MMRVRLRVTATFVGNKGSLGLPYNTKSFSRAIELFFTETKYKLEEIESLTVSRDLPSDPMDWTL